MRNAKNYFMTLLALGMVEAASAEITVDPRAIEIEFGEDGVAEERIAIGNNGDEQLVWRSRIESEGVPPHDPANIQGQELVAQFQGINGAEEYCSPVGWDWDNNRMWVTNYTRRLAVSYSFENYFDFEEEVRFDCGRAMDGAWANGIFFLPLFSDGLLRRFDAEGNLINSIEMPFIIYGLAADDEHDWLFLLSNAFNIHVYELSRQGVPGEEIGSIENRNHLQFHGNTAAYGLEWISKHSEGQLWMFSNGDSRIHQIAVDTEEWECTGEIQAFRVIPDGGDQPYTSVAHDGYNLWAAGHQPDNIRIYDDGEDEQYWISLDPRNGAVDPGNEMWCDLTCDETGLIEGDYDAAIHILSNDEDNPDISVEIIAHVTGVPDLQVVWSDSAGFPEVIDFNAAFEDLFVGVSYSIDLTCMNQGNSDLAVDGFEFEHGYFSLDTVGFVVAAGEELTVALSFNPRSARRYNDTLVVVSSDPDQQRLFIPVRAEPLNPPIFQVTPGSMEIELVAENGREERSIHITNEGVAPLRWRGIVVPDEILGHDEPNATIITMNPDSGRLISQNTREVSLEFEMEEWEDREESYNIIFRSNDPFTPEVIFDITLRWLGVENDSLSLPTDLALNFLYPNPFNSTASLQFNLPKPSRAEVGLFDQQGRRVAVLASGDLQTGVHRVEFDAGAIPAGVYLLRLEAGGEVKTAKAVVVR